MEARARDLEVAQRLAEAALLETRHSITALRTGTLSWEEFLDALTACADEFSSNHEVEVLLTTDGELPELPASFQAEVLRILGEIFTNAVRHGGATELSVSVTAHATGLEITVGDNGRGFDWGSAASKMAAVDQALAGSGVGLKSIIERLQRHGGKLAIESNPGHGTTLRVWLPLARPPGARRPT
jgi:two-component system NarL family sensor kinase